MDNSYKKINFARIYKIIREGRFRYYINKLLWIDADHRKISSSISLGVFIGVFVPVGFQTIITVPLALFLKRNVILAVLFTLVTNPLTIFPIYYLVFKIGEFITNLKISEKDFNNLLTEPGLLNIMAIGKTGLMIFFSGAFVLAIPISIGAYIVSDHVIRYMRTRDNKSG